jgi:type 1 glutamine amidotransferase
LIIARNAPYWPDGYGKPQTAWMTDDQQKAPWDFVENGGGFLALHNTHTMYPKDGLYYKLFGGHPRPCVFTIRVARDNQQAAAGWWRGIGKGRFCHLSPGHTPEALNHPMMQRLIRNAARWLLRMD